MPTSNGPLRRIAIAGAIKSGEGGHTTGNYIAKSILEMNQYKPGTFTDVLIIGRGELAAQNKIKQASAKELMDMGARYASIDYSNEQSMVSALKGIDCVISCLSVADPQAIEVSEIALVRASAKAGVTRFFPSQYGPDDENLPKERRWRISMRKKAVVDEVTKCGMEYTAVVTGIYYDVIWAHKGVFDWFDDGQKTKGIIAGPNGTGTIMSISLDDIGNYIAAMCADPNQENSRNRTVRLIVETWKTGDEIGIYEEVTGRKVEVDRYPLGDGVKDRSAYPQYPRLIAHNHYWIDPALNDCHRWPQIKPKGMKAWLAEKWATGSLMKFNRDPRKGGRPEAAKM